mgnify:CR=1 FL=1
MSLFVVFFPLVVTIAGTLVFMTKTKGNPELLKKTLDLWDSCFATGFQPAAEWIMERSKTRQAAWYKFIVGVNILIVGLMIIMDLFISIPFIIIGFLYFRCIRNNPGEDIDYALLLDGLKAEREQGITIDVAYRYFSTAKRKFIIADTPGHEQYTRNMATGASTCDLAIILIDARHGVQVQTRRHAYIASLLGIRHVVVAINKMDLIDYDEARYNEIVNDYMGFISKLY